MRDFESFSNVFQLYMYLISLFVNFRCELWDGTKSHRGKYMKIRLNIGKTGILRTSKGE